MTIELRGIVLHGRHGVLEHERRDGQRFLVDVELDLADEPAARTDGIEDAVDYRRVVARVSDVSDARAYNLLEALAAALADALLARLPGRRGSRARAEARRRARAARRVRGRHASSAGAARASRSSPYPPRRDPQRVDRLADALRDVTARYANRPRPACDVAARASRRRSRGRAGRSRWSARATLVVPGLPEAEVDVRVGGHGRGHRSRAAAARCGRRRADPRPPSSRACTVAGVRLRRQRRRSRCRRAPPGWTNSTSSFGSSGSRTGAG